ncbi:MAG TPA: LPS export ABC transporter periplasmic protein LptC [Stellaceae bacterium]|nr:LPS export ABC transporter periplasmic protein LptC [Stellaceae bacterium]
MSRLASAAAPAIEVAVDEAPRAGLGLPMRERLRSVRYSQFVARAKFTMPVAAGAIILLLGAWPALTAGFDRLWKHLPRLDVSLIRDLRMVSPRYTGIDRNGRPFTITADAAREEGINTGTAESLVALDGPKADILTKEGAWIVGSGKTGIYQPQTHYLDLSGDVELFHDKGYRLKTTTARVDLDAGGAEGHDPVAGDGPSATLKGEGFRVLQKGDTLLVTGKSELVILGAHSEDQ